MSMRKGAPCNEERAVLSPKCSIVHLSPPAEGLLPESEVHVDETYFPSRCGLCHVRLYGISCSWYQNVRWNEMSRRHATHILTLRALDCRVENVSRVFLYYFLCSCLTYICSQKRSCVCYEEAVLSCEYGIVHHSPSNGGSQPEMGGLTASGRRRDSRVDSPLHHAMGKIGVENMR